MAVAAANRTESVRRSTSSRPVDRMLVDPKTMGTLPKGNRRRGSMNLRVEKARDRDKISERLSYDPTSIPMVGRALGCRRPSAVVTN